MRVVWMVLALVWIAPGVGRAQFVDPPHIEALNALIAGGTAEARWTGFQEVAKRARAGGNAELRDAFDLLEVGALALGWSGALSDVGIVRGYAAAAARDWPATRPFETVRALIGAERADPVLHAIAWEPPPDLSDGIRPPGIPGMGVVVVFRPVTPSPSPIVSALVPTSVSIGDAHVGMLHHRQATWVYLRPGTHELRVAPGTSPDTYCSLSIEVRDGSFEFFGVSDMRTPGNRGTLSEGWFGVKDGVFMPVESPEKLAVRFRGMRPRWPTWQRERWNTPVESILRGPP